jgi:hypothetical protein
VTNARKLPNLASMFNDLGYGDVLYIPIQRMGSHAVHGTWSELVSHYLKYEDERFYPRDHEIDTQDAQFIVIIHLVLGAMESFLRHVIADVPDRGEIIATLHEIDEKITEMQHLAWAPDFSVKS